MVQPQGKLTARQKTLRRFRKDIPLLLLMVPGLIYYLVFEYGPMYGIVMAFQNFRLPRGIAGSEWIGLENFRKFMTSAFFPIVMRNTITISIGKILVGFPIPVILALMLNEVRVSGAKRTMQTVMYMPHFVSWVVCASLVELFFAPSGGIVSQMLQPLGIDTKWMISNDTFRWVLIWTDVWKNAGWGTIIHMAALTSIDPMLYEAATIDGANKRQQIFRITLPCMLPTLVSMLILRMGGIMGAGHEQILLMQNASVYMTSEVLSTYIFKRAFVEAEYGLSSAAGLFQSLIGMVMVIISNRLSKSVGEGRIW